MKSRIRYRKPPKKIRVRNRKKTEQEQRALDQVNNYLNKYTKDLAVLIYLMFKQQRESITLQQLLECIVVGGETMKVAQKIGQDYDVFYSEEMVPAMLEGMETGAKNAVNKEQFVFSAEWYAVQNWLSQHGAEWKSNMARQTQNAIAEIVRLASFDHYGIEEVANVAGTAIGLTPSVAGAVWRNYTAAKKQIVEETPDMAEEKARARALETAKATADSRHRNRATDIAEAELAYSYHEGAMLGVEMAIAMGMMSDTVRVWCTAEDERVCAVCDNLDGVEVGMNDPFPIPRGRYYAKQNLTPPAHPRCRCTVMYLELTSTILGAGIGGRVLSETDSGMDEKILEENGIGFANNTISDIINTEQITGALDSFSPRAEKHALQYYESVRHMTKDTERIAVNVGWKKEAIDAIKRHVFLEEHDLMDGHRRFDPSYDIAQSWQRLIDGKNIRRADIILLKHEYLELSLMKRGYSQDEAHIIASGRYNYADAIEEE